MSASVFLIIVLVSIIFLLGFLYLSALKFKKDAEKKGEEIKNQIYELSILKEIGDRIEFSLNLENIVDIIAGSLSKFIDYRIAGYMLLSPKKILFKIKIEEEVSRVFVDNVKKRMLSSLSALLDKEFFDSDVEEIVLGVISSKNKEDSVESFFNIPLVVGGNIMGVLTIAHTVSGLYKENEMTLLYKVVADALSSIARLDNVIKTEHGKLGAMVKGMIDGVLMTDKDYRIIVANPAMKLIAGVNKKSDLTVFDFISGFGHEFNLKSKLEESVTLGRTLKEEDVVIGDRIFQILASPVTDNDDILGGVIVFHDTSRMKQAEKIKEDFISMLVHELRTPLDGIKKIGELMKSDDSIRKNIKTHGEYIGMIYQSSSEMLKLVNKLLDVSKIESGKFDVYRKPTSIEKIIKQSIKSFDTIVKDSDIKLNFVFSEDIPKVVNLDTLKISQVLSKLISNAIEYTSKGGSVTVQVFMHKDGSNLNNDASEAGIEWFSCKDGSIEGGDSIVVAVTDTGDGISEENMARLFNKFIKFGSSTKKSGRGTGLGLVIAKGVIEAHDGILRVNSKKGDGSTFYFTIKL